ncbi:hypothetical protein F4778DRAFT_354652 [Xylariomycetidae sp. FL2044]|nr:hypothetical protein F4778DRAFT_354652 [Xylariomycetidae sp. FL2044]
MSQLKEMARVTLFGSRNTSAPSAGQRALEPARDIPDLSGKVVLITGAAGDLGRQTAVELARYGRPARVYVADLPRDADAKRSVVERIRRESSSSRRVDDGEKEKDDDNDDQQQQKRQVPDVDVRFLDLDLTVFESVRRCADDFLAQEERLDILVLNAGIIRVAPGTTKEGYEVHFGLNYLGHALLARLLLPTLLRTAERSGSDVRVVVVSSEGHANTPAGGIQFDKLKSDCADMSYAQRYGQSKLALIGLARELAQRHPQLKTAAVHPGRILTGMAASLRKESLFVRLTAPLAPLVCVSVELGVRNHLWAATSPDVVSGKYYEPVGVPDRETQDARDPVLSAKVWEWTESELGAAGLLPPKAES